MTNNEKKEKPEHDQIDQGRANEKILKIENYLATSRKMIKDYVSYILDHTEQSSNSKTRLKVAKRPQVEAIWKFVLQCQNTQSCIMGILKSKNLKTSAIKQIIEKENNAPGDLTVYFDRLKDIQNNLQHLNIDPEALFDISAKTGKKIKNLISPYDLAMGTGMRNMNRATQEINNVGTEQSFTNKQETFRDIIADENNYIEDEGEDFFDDIPTLDPELAEAILKGSMSKSFDDPRRKDSDATIVTKGVKEYAKMSNKIQEQVDNNYFDWLGFYTNYIENNLRSSFRKSRGSLVITPYVQKILDDIGISFNKKNSRNNPDPKPVFLKGDLGSGKTQMALHYGRVSDYKNIKNIKEAFQENPYYKEFFPHYEFLDRGSLESEFSQLSKKEKEALAREYILEKKQADQKYAESRAKMAEEEKAIDPSFTLLSEEIDPFEKLTEEEKINTLMKDPNKLLTIFKKQQIQKGRMDNQILSEPIIVSGHKEFDPAQFVGGFEIVVDEIDPKKFAEQYSIGLSEFDKLDNTDLSEQQINELKDAYKNKIGGSHIITKAYLGKIFQAMLLGKTFIIDEINAIPHEILILLNHYITYKPGDPVQPPVNNLKPFNVAQGFKIIATGNIPKEDQQGYHGRQLLDAAFLSRFNRVEVDYLPNNTEKLDAGLYDNQGNLRIQDEQGQKLSLGMDAINEDNVWEYLGSLSNEERSQMRHGGVAEDGYRYQGMEKNELFQSISSIGLRQHIAKGAYLPKNYFPKIYQLCRVSRILQNIYKGINPDQKHYIAINGKPPTKIMKYAVPSMRMLTDVVNMWVGEGCHKDLDFYLWKYFIQQFEGAERSLVWQYYHQLGGFFNDQIFPQTEEQLGNFQLLGDLKKDERIFDRTVEKKIFSQQEILENMFGLGPKPEKIEDLVSVEAEEDIEEEKMRLLDEINSLKSRISIFVDDYKESIYGKYCQK